MRHLVIKSGTIGSRLRPVERRFPELGIWGSDQLIEKRGRKLEVWKGGKWEKEGKKSFKWRGGGFYRLIIFKILRPGGSGCLLVIQWLPDDGPSQMRWSVMGSFVDALILKINEKHTWYSRFRWRSVARVTVRWCIR